MPDCDEEAPAVARRRWTWPLVVQLVSNATRPRARAGFMMYPFQDIDGCLAPGRCLPHRGCLWRTANTQGSPRRYPTVAGFNVGSNNGTVAGQTVPHFHMHLIPRRAGDAENPRGGVRAVIPGKADYAT